jgi:hypothetical protein
MVSHVPVRTNRLRDKWQRFMRFQARSVLLEMLPMTAAAFPHTCDTNLEGTNRLCGTLTQLEETKARAQLHLRDKDIEAQDRRDRAAEQRDLKRRRDEWVMVCPP